jgi:glutathione S-transferase
MRIYGDLQSGNCLKVKWTADALGLPYTWVPVDIMKGESRTPEYLARFPMGQVPAVELADGRCLSQSNAIMRYLARGSALLPEDPFTAAEVDAWMFWEQNSHEFFVAGCRFHMVYLGQSKGSREPMRVARGEQALDLMNSVLRNRLWFAGRDFSIADIALVAYTRVADEGGFDLATRPHVKEWIGRCEARLGLKSGGTPPSTGTGGTTHG